MTRDWSALLEDGRPWAGLRPSWRWRSSPGQRPAPSSASCLMTPMGRPAARQATPTLSSALWRGVCRRAGGAGAGARAVAEALPAVVTVINELPAAQGGGVAGGAGFIADARGFVVTNEHLVSVQGKLSVVLNDGEIRPAELVSHDAPFTDLAVLRIPAGGLTALDLGDSEALALGETLIALGSPDIDYRNSVTVGVVSGLGRRKLLGGIYREDLIQTDAAINVGSSGGPLVNLRGEVVGVVSFRDIGAEDPLFGISFAISSRTMRPIVEPIIARGGAG